MLVKNIDIVAGECSPAIRKILYTDDYPQGRDASREGAFSANGKLKICINVPRMLGVSRVLLNIAPDGRGERSIPLEFVDSDHGIDSFEATLVLKELCENGDNGLFYYDISFFIGNAIIWSCTSNNVDFTLKNTRGNKFRLLVFSPEFKVPRWLGANIIYHIFVDRFANSKIISKKCDENKKRLLYRDWIPQFADIPGGDVSNDKFFEGDIEGISQKLEYLSSLGVGTVYLSPIFKSPSNHRYDTSDYEKIDDRLGGDEAFFSLLEKLKKKGMRVILDGVFNHTGSDSKYFDKFGKYSEIGAYESVESPYFDWYNFRKFPNEYECWWNIEIMPRLNHSNPHCRHFFTGKRGIGAKYAELGIGGWRLDVADELSDNFLNEFRKSIKHISDDAVIIGEVWENAADKISYGKRREYFRGYQLDSVMNYPLRNAIIDFVLHSDGQRLYDVLVEIYSSYPRIVSDSLMNLLGTHDTDRILTVLADVGCDTMSNTELSVFRLNEKQREKAKQRLVVASTIQYTVYGTPSLYYGDEAGLEGGRDPFCRMPYPWGDQDTELLCHYIRLGKIRREQAVFDGGDFIINGYGNGKIVYTRQKGKESVTIVANCSTCSFSINIYDKCQDLLDGKKYTGNVSILPMSVKVLKKQN